MLNRNRFLLLSAASALLFTGCGKSDGLAGLACHMGTAWTTVDDYAPTSASGYISLGLAADTNSNVYAVGSGFLGADGSWVVRKSADRGGSWTTVDNYVKEAGSQSSANSIFADFTGGVYAVGNPTDASHGYWEVRKSSDGGGTWTTIDSVADGSARAGIYRTGLGLNVFGSQSDGVSDNWVSRLSSDGGSSWTAKDKFLLSNLNAASATAAAATADLFGNLYVAGQADDATPIGHWNVRKSADGGSTWKTVDDYTLSASAASEPTAIVADVAGNVFVSGKAVDDSGKTYWTVRKSADGGSTWTNIRSVQQNGGESDAAGVAFDHLGNIYVAGYSTDAQSHAQWLVETSKDGGASWTTSDSFAYSGAESGQAQAIGFSPTGDIYVTGAVTLTGGAADRWVTRKLSCD